MGERPAVSVWEDLCSEIFEKYNYTCQDCGATGEQIGYMLFLHHIVPLWDGGTNHPENLTVLCKDCHKKKHAEDKKKRQNQQKEEHYPSFTDVLTQRSTPKT